MTLCPLFLLKLLMTRFTGEWTPQHTRGRGDSAEPGTEWTENSNLRIETCAHSAFCSAPVIILLFFLLLLLNSMLHSSSIESSFASK